MLSGIEASASELSDEDIEKEYAALLAVFQRFIDDAEGGYEDWEILEELMELRADFLVRHAIDGFGMSWEDMLELLEKDAQQLGKEEQEQVFIIRAAIDNLVDFAVVEEYQLAEDVKETVEEVDEMSEDELDEVLLSLNKRYNYVYANVENSDACHAMVVAAAWMKFSEGATLMYMTQGDERVRPWHMDHEGFTAPKAFFPQWLIPPIEHQCRCYLVEVDGTAKIADVSGKIFKTPEMPAEFNRTFKESVAKGGRIFSDEHPYFQVASKDYDRLHEISDRIKSKYIK